MDLRQNRGRGMAKLSRLSKRTEYCSNCIPYINGTCSGHKINIQDCSEYVPDIPDPKRRVERNLLDDEELHFS